MRRPLMLLLVVALGAAGCGGGGVVRDTTGSSSRAPSATATTAPAAGTTRLPTTSVAPPSTDPTTSVPRDLSPIGLLADGLFCRDLEAMGYPYQAAGWYWIAQGEPSQMDADGNGIPCETVYPPESVATFWDGPLNAGWTPIQTTWTVQPGCCANPTTGPTSPMSPIPPDEWPADGFYAATATWAGEPSTLTLTMWRWVSCDDIPGACLPDQLEDGITADPASETVRTVDLTDPEITVVLRPINEAGADGSFGALEGSGTAFAALLNLLDEGPAPVDPWFGWPPSVQGPYGTYLTEQWSIPSLELRAGRPVLWIWAGQIAG